MSNDNPLLAGIDIGTTGTKVTIYTPSGHIVATSYLEYQLIYPEPGAVEFPPHLWWEATSQAFQEIFKRQSINPRDIAGIGVSSSNAIVLLDEQGEPLCPAIMQLDRRSAGMEEKIRRELGEETVQSLTQNRVSSGAYWGPTLLWLSRERQVDMGRIRYLMTPHSYINFKLTNIYSIDYSRASTTMLYNWKSGKWDPQLCKFFGIRETQLPSISDPAQIIGTVSIEASNLTGLLTGTPVIAGCMDSLAAHIGVGGGEKNASLVLGSVGRICFDTTKFDYRFMNIKNSTNGSAFTMSPVNGTGISYKWLKKLLFEGDDRFWNKEIFEEMNRLASEAPPGSNGIIYHPYLTGERSPIWKPEARGSFNGLTETHTRRELIRSVLEGVGYSLAHNYSIIKKSFDIEFDAFYASGGGANSQIWLQILADILGVEIKTVANSESETLGLSRLIAGALGVSEQTLATQPSVDQILDTYIPNSENHKLYQQYLNIYLEVLDRNMNIYAKIAELQVYSKE